MEKFDLPKPPADSDFKQKPKKKMIKRVCSWCKADMGFKEGAEGDGEITHGICEKCSKEMETESE